MGAGNTLALAGTDAAAAVPLFGAQAASRLRAPLLAASTASVTPLLVKLPPHCSLSCTPCQPGGSCCVLCGSCGFDPRCN